jgi:hypothetical protein
MFVEATKFGEEDQQRGPSEDCWWQQTQQRRKLRFFYITPFSYLLEGNKSNTKFEPLIFF